MKIKINLKKEPDQLISLTHLNQFTGQKVPKIIPYVDSDDINDSDGPDGHKISIKPKVTLTPNIKINIKSHQDENQPVDINITPDPNIQPLTSIEPKVVVKGSSDNVRQVIIININKKHGPKNYKSKLLLQKPIKSKNIPKIILPSKFEVQTFYCDGLNYFIHEATGYIFSPHCYEDANPEPIGQLKEDDLAVDDFKKDKYPLLKKEIIWFYHYELDAEMVD